MQTSILLNRGLNEIIFDGRNKTYGAFILRLHYHRSMSRAMLISMTVFLLVIVSPMIVKKTVSEVWPEHTIPVVLTPPYVDPLKKPVPIPKVNASPLPLAKSQISLPKVVADDVPEALVPPPQSKFSGTSTPSPSGADPNTGLEPGIEDSPPAEIHPAVIEEKIEEPMLLFAVEQKPEFPDGDAALYKYINDHLDVPSIAREIGENVNVVVQFVIGKDGNVYNVIIIRSTSPVMDKAAMKVVSEMPRWKPGKHNGKPVEVIFNLPIRLQFE